MLIEHFLHYYLFSLTFLNQEQMRYQAYRAQGHIVHECSIVAVLGQFAFEVDRADWYVLVCIEFPHRESDYKFIYFLYVYFDVPFGTMMMCLMMNSVDFRFDRRQKRLTQFHHPHPRDSEVAQNGSHDF